MSRPPRASTSMDRQARAEIGPYKVLRILEATQLWTEHLALCETTAEKSEIYRLWLPGPGTVANHKAVASRMSPLLAIKHENLERVIDSGADEEDLYVVFEYQPGKSLSYLVQAHAAARGPLPVSVSLHIAIETLRGLAAAQKFGIDSITLNHGWLSPQVINLAFTGQVQLRHLGLASGCMWGSDFLSKSLGNFGHELSPEADVRAVAQILKGLLLPSPRSDVSNKPELPASLARILARALSPSAAARYVDAQAMLDDLLVVRDKGWEVHTPESISELLVELFGHELAVELDEVVTLTSSQKTEAIDPPAPEVADSAPPPGTVINGRYRLLCQIGRGAAGVVFEAEHIELGQRVAIKMLDRDYSRDHHRVERFRREARAASRIGHPNIIRVTDLGRAEDQRFYYVMDLVRGTNLARLIRNEGYIEPERAVNIMLQVCDALDAAHRMSVIHRDLKPENIVLTTDAKGCELAQVVDFGLSLTLDSKEKRLTREGQAVGTPYYMAPEQVRGDPADNRTDIYAAGAILYEMLTGKPLFEYDTVAETLTAHLHDTPIPPRIRAKVREIPVALEQITLKALEKKPENRYQNMKQLATAIRNASVRHYEVMNNSPSDVEDIGNSLAPANATLTHDSLHVIKRSPVLWIAAGGVALLVVFSILVVPRLLGHLSSAPVQAAQENRSAADSSLVSHPTNDAAQTMRVDHDAQQSPSEMGRGDGGSAHVAVPEATPDRSDAQPEKVGPTPPERPVSPRNPRIRDAGAQPSGDSSTTTPSGPSTAELVAEGNNALRQGQVDLALRLFNRARSQSPGNAAAWAGLGRAAFERGQHDQAARNLQRAVDLQPRSVRYRLLLAGALMRAGRAAEARSQYQEVLRQDPENSVARRMLDRP